MRCSCWGGAVCDHKLPCEARPAIGLCPECERARICGRCGKGDSGDHDWDCLDGPDPWSRS